MSLIRSQTTKSVRPTRRTAAALAVATALAGALLVQVSPASAGTTSGSTAAPAGAHPLTPRTHAAAPAVITGALIKNGGPVQTAPRVYVDFWGWTSDPHGEQAYLTNFLSSVGGTPWLATVNQYGADSPGHLLAGTWSDPAAVPASPSDAQIQAEAASAAAHFGTGNSVNVQIVVATPTGHSTPGFGTQWCAYHGAVSADRNITYTDLPYISDAGTSCGQGSVNGANGTLDGVSIVEGHELAEAITDPLLNAWIDAGGNEIGDKCAWYNLANISTSAGTFAVQPLWSNAANGCALSTNVALNVIATIGTGIYHEQRYADGSWSGLNGQTTAAGTVTASGSSTDGAGNLQVVLAIGSAIYHEIRYANGSWSGLGYQTTAPGAISSISAAYDRAGNLLDVVATVGSSIYHEQRYANGSWSTLNFQTTAPGTITASGSSTDGNGNLQVVLAIGSAIYHEIRYANGSWSGLGFQTTAAGTIGSISAAYDRADNLLNVVATVGNAVYHEQRYADGSWSTLNFQTTAAGTIGKNGSSTDDAGNLQVVLAIGSAIYHEIRYANGSWSGLSYQITAAGTIGSLSGGNRLDVPQVRIAG